MNNETNPPNHPPKTPYTPLTSCPVSSTPQEIRLLWLLPAPSNRTITANPHLKPPIQAELTTTALSPTPAYTALSYVWGPPPSPHRQHEHEHENEITLNNHPFKIRPNLYDCLVSLRARGIGTKEESGGVPLWIDAVCINQEDVVERNGHLLVMGDIYRLARGVVSWLGADGRLGRGLGVVREVAGEWSRFKGGGDEDEEKEKGVGDKGVGGMNKGAGDGAEEPSEEMLCGWVRQTSELWHDEKKLDGLVRVFLSEYWMRVWIVQELLLARRESHVYICGGVAPVTEGELDTFADCVLTVFCRDLMEGVMDMGVWTNVRLGVLRQISVRREFARIQDGLVTPGLMFVLYVSYTRWSTDPRDAVYGLLHLIPDHGIVPDYRKPVADVYAEWAVKTMLESRDMDLLAYAGTGMNLVGDRDLGLPSWVPDLRNYKAPPQASWLNSKKRTPCQSAPAFAVQLVEGRGLKVEGRRCHTIKKVTQLPGLQDKSRSWEWKMVSFCLDYLVAQRDRPYPTGIPPLQALVRLVLQSKIDALGLDGDDLEESRGLHELAMGFVAWVMFTYGRCVSEAGDVDKDMGPVNLALHFMGFDWGEHFQFMYMDFLFPWVNVQELFGWSTLRVALDDIGDKAASIIDYIMEFCDKARLIETEDGYLGYGPNNTEPGDGIFAVKHCEGMLALREGDAESVPGSVTLLGSCNMVVYKDPMDDSNVSDGEEEEGHQDLAYQDLLIV